MPLNELSAIVTGAGSGIGEATARRLAADGAGVVVADLNPDSATRVTSELEQAGADALAIGVDVSDPDRVAAMVDTALRRFGRIDILVNSAGTCKSYGGVSDISVEEWDEVINVNLRGTFLCARAAIPSLRKRGGCIVNIASAAALYWPAVYPAYTAAKMGVLGLTQCMARELAPAGIAVKAIRPVYVDTPMGNQAFVEQEGRSPQADDAAVMLSPKEVANIIRTMVDPATACASSTIVDTMVVRGPRPL